MIGYAALLLGALIGLSVPVASAIWLLATWLGATYSPMPLHLAMGEILWQTSTEFLLVAVPLFVLLGEIMVRAGIATRMYDGIAKWLSWLPGGLMHSNIGASAVFAATSGSSLATAATISTVALPEIEKRGYHEPFFLGSIAAGGTLGILIPPSINLIIFGLITSTSVPELYVAGFLPGLLLASLFIATILLAALLFPAVRGQPLASTWRDRFSALPDLVPPLLVFACVIAPIYLGIATPTEAASVGVCASLLLAASFGRLNRRMLAEAIRGTMRTTGMIMLIVLASQYLNFVLGVTGFSSALAGFVSSLDMSPLQTLLAVIALYLVLGCFMEAISMMIITAPIIVPIVTAAGFDPVWFGILLIVLLETALITPPVGMNLYVVQGVRRRGSINDVIIGVLPFLVPMIAMLALLILWPQIALWLPSMVYRS